MIIIKFVSVLFLIFIHLHFFIVTDGSILESKDLLGPILDSTNRFMFIGLFLTILPLLSGYVFRINDEITITNALKISFFILIAGFVMNTSIWGLSSNLSWNILQLLAISFLMTAFLFNTIKHKFGLFFVSILVIFLSEPIRVYLGSDKNIIEFLFFGGENSYNIIWPIFPWMATFLFGFSIADLYLRTASKKFFINLSFFFGNLFLLFGVLSGGAYPSMQGGYVFDFLLPDPSTEWIFSTIGLFLVLFSLGETFFKNTHFSKDNIVTVFSKGILFVYVLQMFLGGIFASFFQKIIHDYSLNVENAYLFLVPILFLLEVFICWKLTKYGINFFSTKNIVFSFKKVKYE